MRFGDLVQNTNVSITVYSFEGADDVRVRFLSCEFVSRETRKARRELVR